MLFVHIYMHTHTKIYTPTHTCMTQILTYIPEQSLLTHTDTDTDTYTHSKTHTHT